MITNAHKSVYKSLIHGFRLVSITNALQIHEHFASSYCTDTLGTIMMPRAKRVSLSPADWRLTYSLLILRDDIAFLIPTFYKASHITDLRPIAPSGVAVTVVLLEAVRAGRVVYEVEVVHNG